jgi:hypothetical protein
MNLIGREHNELSKNNFGYCGEDTQPPAPPVNVRAVLGEYHAIFSRTINIGALVR